MSDTHSPPPGPSPEDRRSGKQSTFLKQSFWSVLIKAASLLLGFVTVVLLARVLGKDAYGIYAVVFATMTVLSIPAALGAPNLMVRETAKTLEADQTERLGALWRQGDMFVLISSIAVVAGLVVWLALSTPSQTYLIAFLAGLALVPLRAFVGLRGGVLRGLGKVVAGQIPEFLLRPALFLALALVLAVMLQDHLDATTTLVAHSIAALLALVGVIALQRKLTPPGTSGGPSPIGMGAMLMASGAMGLVAGAQVLNNNLDVMMLGAMRESGEAGIYKVAASTALLVSFGLQAVNQVLMPRVAASHKRGDLQAMKTVIRQSARLSLGLAAASAVILIAMGPWFLETAFGAEYRAAYPALVILVGGQLLNAAFGPVISVLNMTGHERDTLKGVLIACGLNVALNALLIPPFGVIGAASATAATLVCWNAILFWRVRQRLGLNASAFGGRAR